MEQKIGAEAMDEKNKAIAEFAGWKLEKMGDDDVIVDNDFEFYWFCKYNEKGEKITTWSGEDMEDINEGSTIPFHDDWEWIMPVIERIESMGYKFKICRKRCQICLDDEHERFIVDVKLDSKLLSAHEAVYQFTQKVK
jgi:hypothetical protein